MFQNSDLENINDTIREGFEKLCATVEYFGGEIRDQLKSNGQSIEDLRRAIEGFRRAVEANGKRS